MIKSITTSQMREIDRLMVEKLNIQIVQMMENAGRNAAQFIKEYLGGIEGKKLLILCGKGGNGGDGMVLARHFENWGGKTKTILAGKASELKDVPAHQWDIQQKMGMDVAEYSDGAIFQDFDLIIDCLLGYSIQGDPRYPFDELINKANFFGKSIIAMDLPSGLDGTTGEAANPCIKADATLTLALTKKGLLEEKAKEYVGKLYEVDIGVPKWLYEEVGVEVEGFVESPFTKSPIIN